MTEELKRGNPWLGLESYKEGEVLYGRDDDIRDLTQNVFNDIDTLLYGKSGIGKSSILNAGVIPAARRHGYLPVLVRLSHKEKHPYLLQIRTAIEKAMIPIPVDEVGNEVELSIEEQKQREIALKQKIKKVVESRDKEKESLYEYFHRHTFHNVSGERIKLLIIFDQFEEIFTLQDDESQKKSFFAELADFLNDIMPSELQHNPDMPNDTPKETAEVISDSDFEDLFNDINLDSKDDIPEYVNDNEIHFVFTIREDFLSEFEYYTSAIPSLKQNRYGLRPINEEQAAQIILRPRPGLINEQVAKLIIEKVTGRTDFELDGVPEIEVDSAVLSLYLNRLYDAKTGDTITAELVEQKGGEIIADFYLDAISEISNSTVEYLEDMLLNGNGRRDNITVFDAIHDGGATELELDLLCNKKKILRQFNYAGDLRIEYVHDILCPVVKTHKDERLLLKRQEEEKARIAAEHENMLNQQRRDRKRFRRALLWSFGIIIIIISLWLFNSYWNLWEYEEYYQAFTRQNGWPVGIGKELNKQDVARLTVCYRLVRNGRNPSKPFSRIEVCSSNNKVYLPNFRSPLVGTSEKEDRMANNFSSLNMKVRIIRFSGENESVDAGVSRETYYDERGLLLYAINYYRSIDQNVIDEKHETTSLWAVYVDKNGLPLRVRDNGADRMKVFLTSSDDAKMNKLEMKYMFYDEQGSPQTNDIGCYGFRVVYNKDLSIDSLFHLDPFSLESIVEVRNYDAEKTIYTYYSLETGKITIHNLLGYARRVDVSDEKGNIIERNFYDSNENVFSSNHYAFEKCHYDNYNRLDSISFYDANNNISEYRIFKYSDLSNLKSEESWYSVTNEGHVNRLYLKSNRINGDVTDIIEDDVVRNMFRHEHRVVDTVRNYVDCSFLNREGQLTFDSLEQCCRYTKTMIKHGDGQISVIKYYDENGNLFKSPLNSHIAAIDSAYYDGEGQKRTQVTFDADGNVLKSMGYDYKDGVEITRYALSLDGRTPIRCPEWEIDGLCYYRLNNVKNAQIGFNLAYIQAVSEYKGCHSYVYFPTKDTLDYQFEPIKKQMGENWVRQEQTSITIPPVPNNSFLVQYLHITKLNGEAYKAGLQDGDIVIKKENLGPTDYLLTVIRYHEQNDTWEYPRPTRIAKQNNGMIIYPVAYTKDEYVKYLEGKKHYEN